MNKKKYAQLQHKTDSSGSKPFFSPAIVPGIAGKQVFRKEFTPAACQKTYQKANSFSTLIDLIKDAETQLSNAGYTSVSDRIHVLRGIYYGTTWSADFQQENSPVRNAGFQTYTASLTPDDPRPHLPCGLFEALRASQDISDGSRHVDVGHLLIGLDARQSYTSREINIPTQGGTGLEISTWLGDLGGGAGMLAVNRVNNPSTQAISKFKGSNFGGSINLEGDIAGYVVANDPKVSNKPSPLKMGDKQTLADALQAYLAPTGPSLAWNSRATLFLQMNGALFDASKKITNRSALINTFGDKIADFACWYLVNRLRQQGRLDIKTLRVASQHVKGGSMEIAEIFVDALIHCHQNPGKKLEALGNGPAPSARTTDTPSACTLAIDALEAAEKAKKMLEEGGKMWRRTVEESTDFFKNW